MNLPQLPARPELLTLLFMAVFSFGTERSDAAPEVAGDLAIGLVSELSAQREIVDAQGRMHPQATNLVTFKVEGAGKLAALGNGDPSSLESVQQPQRKAWRGRGLVILRSGREHGPITLTASGVGLKTATVKITSK